MIKSICVQCGSSTKISGKYINAAYNLGKVLANNKINLVYGGSNIGLMGAVARGAIDNSGHVTGVITNELKDKVEMLDITQLIIVETMHERKSIMNELSSAFIALPGGYGTFEEFFEAITWNQLKIINKACGILNINGYYDLLLQFVNHSVNEGFIHRVHKDLIICETEPEILIKKMNEFTPINIDKWW